MICFCFSALECVMEIKLSSYACKFSQNSAPMIFFIGRSMKLFNLLLHQVNTTDVFKNEFCNYHTFLIIFLRDIKSNILFRTTIENAVLWLSGCYIF